DQGPDQPLAQLDQVLQQRHRLVVDGIVVSCGHGPSSCCRENRDQVGGRWSMDTGGMKGGGGGGAFGPSTNGARGGGTRGGPSTRAAGGGWGSAAGSSGTFSAAAISPAAIPPLAVTGGGKGSAENVSRRL